MITIELVMEYLDDIKNAIKETNKPYRKWEDWYKKKNVMLKRVFCYEFYHQFRTIMKPHENEEKYKDLYFQGEMTKYNILPDFVLHGGQDNTDIQVVAIEVKTAERIRQNQQECNMKNDLLKLLELIADKHLQYKYGLFIGVNCDNDFFTEEFKKMCRCTIQNYSDLYDRVYIMGTDDVENPQTLNYYLG